MRVEMDIRDLEEGTYVVFILSSQITCMDVEYADNHTRAMKILNKYKKLGNDCIISRVLNNTLNLIGK